MKTTADAILGITPRTSASTDAGVTASTISPAQLVQMQIVPLESMKKAAEIAQSIPADKPFIFSATVFTETCEWLNMTGGDKLLRRIQAAKSPLVEHMLAVIAAPLQEKFLETYQKQFSLRRV